MASITLENRIDFDLVIRESVYRALYDYAAQSDEELNINADDLLYLLEKSEVDDWWKVKKRVIPVGDEEVDEPVGLVPSNYIEEAPIVERATSLYDYDKQTEEEISFKEGERFNVFDMNDPDWYLVGDAQTNQLFGYVPANYLEVGDQKQLQQLEIPTQEQTPNRGQNAPGMSLANFAPPPLHRDRGMSASPQSQPQFQPPPMHPSQVQNESAEHERSGHQEEEVLGNDSDDDDAPPPPMPSRPLNETPVRENKRLPTLYGKENEEDINDNTEHKFDGEYFTWYIDEVDGRKKRSVIFSIGQGNVILKPNTSNPKKLKLKSASSLDQQWKIKDLTDFSHEKKHLFLEFKNPGASIELHTGSKDVAEAIISILGDLKGAENAKGLREVAKASQASTGGSNRKIGRLMYDFEAQGSDELMSKEGDEVYIINETKSKDWWMCENIDTKRQGVIPSSYIEIVGTSNLEKLTEGPQRQKSTRSNRSSRGRVVQSSDDHGHRKSKNHHRSREERNKIREHDRMQRDKSSQGDSNDKSMPNYHRVRTWIDSSGSFKVEAEFLGCVEGKIHLHKTNGVKIAVAATKLSLEDLEYVEKITGTSLESYKQEVTKQNVKRSKSQSQKTGVTQSATSAINDIAPPQPTRPKTTTALSTSEPEYDWFEFFLSCGVDLGNCQRYTLNFNREQMDENILADINPSLLRTLGLREGDILRVMKFLDNKFDRKKSTAEEPNVPAGGLFTEPTGALKNNNSAAEVHKVDPKALPSPLRSEEQIGLQQTPSNKFEDDAWAVKPAARSSEDVSKLPASTSSPVPTTPAAPQQPQYTGALQDLVNIKPLELNNKIPPPASQQEQKPSAPTLTPVKTGNGVSSQSTSGQVSSQRTGGLIPVQRTGGLVPVQRTGGLIPVQQTGGLSPVQPTGFMPITAQPTGFIPIQATGVLQPQLTFGIVPLQTGTTTFTGQATGQQQKTGSNIPQTTFGQPAFQPLQTGNVTLPQTTFGQAPMMTGQATGGMPPTSFGGQPLSMQRTGPLVPAQRTGGQVTGGMMPQTSFGQSNSVMMPQTSFGMQNTLSFQPMGGQATGGNSFPSFGGQATGGNSFPSFGGQTTGGFQPINNIMPQQPSFGNQIPGGFQSNMQQQPSFGQPQMVPQTSFGVQQQQPSFNQFQQQPNMNQLSNMFQNTGINGSNTFNQPQSQFPATSFGQQPQFQPLQSQPTGAGFGNAPSTLQNQPTGGRRANLQAATPDNPFGF